jgi:23S rRNA-/tRNA-specific pseudouridylate synthase
MPVHACGNFLHNTLVKIVEAEHGFENLGTVHRLDRQTSGIVFFAKKESASNEFREAMIANRVSKVYYARVRGDFSKACKPTAPDTGDKDSSDKPSKLQVVVKNWIYCESNIEAKWVCCDQAEIPFEFKHKAKDAETLFKFVKYSPSLDQSIVKCYPRTGRTHQIRVHLQHLGHSISNDQMYGGTIFNHGDDADKV